MLIKIRDANESRIEKLERMEASETDPTFRLKIQYAIASSRADSGMASACTFIDKQLADSPDWMLLHDLRLVCDKKIAHANHVLIDSALHFYWIDSRYFNDDLVISESGVFSVSSGVIASPLEHLKTDLGVLSSILSNHTVVPNWPNQIVVPDISGFIITRSLSNNTLESDDPGELFPLVTQENFSQHVINSGGRRRFWEGDDFDEAFHQVATALADLHYPLIDRDLMLSD